MRRTRLLAAAVSSAGFAASALAAPITFDMNGFPNRAGGHIGGPGLEEPLEFEGGAAKVVLENPQPGATYSFDFYHNSGEGSSDFTFTLNEDGSGVASVTPGGNQHAMFKGFKPGDATLKFVTFPIVYNARGGQTATYSIGGLVQNVPAEGGAQNLTAVPGAYAVDNLTNTAAGREDFAFVVGADGKVAPVNGSGEFAEFRGNAVEPRSAWVRFRVVADGPINYHPTHKHEPAQAEGNTYELEMRLPVGGGGVNVWSFGDVKVDRSNVLIPGVRTPEDPDPEDVPLQGKTTANDFLFYPRLRHDAAKGFYFVTAQGPATSVSAEASGSYDGGEKPLKVTVTATLIQKPTVAPRTAPAAGSSAATAPATTPATAPAAQ